MRSTPSHHRDVELHETDILAWLREEDSARLEKLWALADDTRRAHVGDEVHLRGLVEISNHCIRDCGYCGLRADNRGIARYRMTSEEILGWPRRRPVRIRHGGHAGGRRLRFTDWLADHPPHQGRHAPLVTLSLGEPIDLAGRGADRYLLRFETSDRASPDHPPRCAGRCVGSVRDSRPTPAAGVQVGSGVMVGLPGQS